MTPPASTAPTVQGADATTGTPAARPTGTPPVIRWLVLATFIVILGTALVVTVMTTRAATLVNGGADPVAALLDGLRSAFWVGAGVSVLVVVLAVRLPNRPDTTDAPAAGH